jgi:hypothetical protein
VMNRPKALYHSWGIACAGTQVYAPPHRAEWLSKITETGVRSRAELTYQQLDGRKGLRQVVRRDLSAESRTLHYGGCPSKQGSWMRRRKYSPHRAEGEVFLFTSPFMGLADKGGLICDWIPEWPPCVPPRTYKTSGAAGTSRRSGAPGSADLHS